MQSPKHAWAFQIEFKGSMYTPKLPINRSSGHYVNDAPTHEILNEMPGASSLLTEVPGAFPRSCCPSKGKPTDCPHPPGFCCDAIGNSSIMQNMHQCTQM